MANPVQVSSFRFCPSVCICGSLSAFVFAPSVPFCGGIFSVWLPVSGFKFQFNFSFRFFILTLILHFCLTDLTP
jgi:hypothetical protein